MNLAKMYSDQWLNREIHVTDGDTEITGSIKSINLVSKNDREQIQIVVAPGSLDKLNFFEADTDDGLHSD